ncbi:hypothetical protein ACFFX1_21395 [Dactylosporangium sucinum]|uniref:Uncharacterized protein n=1 Tax=Dactylosporangium sucinum TaxID=1424081 RepID=A0A917X7E8_9ACTN|nr:hypothetical protein [Dactylosporangium sucinum]GGM89913.1 hypothetical protein GCM10007977_109960 [Dactylosporangium sucinum]
MNDPTRLAEKAAAAVDRLAACLATDVQIDPGRVILPLIQTAHGLHDIADELSRAAISVDEAAAAAARAAAENFLHAATELGNAMLRLPEQSR